MAVLSVFMTELLTHLSAFPQALFMPRMADMVTNEVRVAPRPIGPPMEKRAVPVIARPVGVHRERDDRNVHLRGINRQQYAAIMVKEFQIVGVDPAAVARPAHVAPVVVGDAAVDIHVGSVRNCRYHGKFGRRTGTHTY